MQVLARCLASRSPRSAAHRGTRPTGWALGLTLVLLTARPLAAQVTLAWNPSPSAGVDGYRVHYGLQSGAYTTSLDVGPVTTTTVAGLSSGQTYYFAVNAYDRTDGVESVVSNEVSTTLPPSGSPVPTPPNGSPAPGGLITLEAEAMALTGYLVESNADASGEALISRRGAAGAPPGIATAAFPGPAGTYDIIVAYFDENDGQSTLALRVNGQVVDTWLANTDLPDSGASAVTLTYRVAASGFPLAPGDVIALQGSEQGGEYARFDKVDFVPVSSAVPVSSPLEVIVDNQDPSTTQSGIWNVSSGANPWAGQSLYSATVNATFRWTPLLPLAGTYQVYAWWTYRASRSTTVPYQIQHQAGTTTVTVNQQDEALGGRWNLLGTFPFAAGSVGSVAVSGQNGNACADAVRFVKP